jgi:transposase
VTPRADSRRGHGAGSPGSFHAAFIPQPAQRGCHHVIPCGKPRRQGGQAPPAGLHPRRVDLRWADAKRQAAKWRCSTGECSPASCWIKADRLHTLIPRTSMRWKKLYRQRGAVEREFGRLKNEWALLRLRVRRLERVQLHADLTILALLACALANTRAIPLADTA